MFILSTLFTFVLALSVFTTASPIMSQSPPKKYATQTNIIPPKAHALVVYSPTITYPASTSVVWIVGTRMHVQWDTKNMPAERMDSTGTLLLGYIKDGPTGYQEGEHLDVYHPLARGFQIAAGNVNFTVPAVPYRRDYVVVLLGDSGNASEKFTIMDGAKKLQEWDLYDTES